MSVVNKPGQSSDSAGLFRSPKFFARVRTAAILGISALVAIHCTLEWPLWLVLGFLVVLGSIELNNLLRRPSSIVFFGLIAGLVAATYGGQAWAPLPLISLGLLVVGSIAVWYRSLASGPRWFDVATTAWIAGPIASAMWLHQASLDPTRLFSQNLLFVVAMPLWLGDTAAYFVGKAYGKHPLAPVISPNKTWEGAFANLAVSLLATFVIGSSFGLPPAVAVSVGLIIGVFGQLGDLLQSQLKRASDLKDSGGVLPGHGGVLDRIDSFLLSSVPAAVTLWLMVPELFHVKQ